MEDFSYMMAKAYNLGNLLLFLYHQVLSIWIYVSSSNFCYVKEVYS